MSFNYPSVISWQGWLCLEVTVVLGLWRERKWRSKGHTVSIQLSWRSALDPYCLVVLSILICLNIPVSRGYICWINLSWTESWSIFAEHSNLRAAEQELAAELEERSRTVFIKPLRVRKLNRIQKVNIWCSLWANLPNLCNCQVGLANNQFLISLLWSCPSNIIRFFQMCVISRIYLFIYCHEYLVII